jgi:hypothetical protein
MILTVSASGLDGNNLIDTAEFQIMFEFVDFVVVLKNFHILPDPREVSGFVFPKVVVGIDH